MGYKSFDIYLNNPTGIYSAGSEVIGKVVLVLDKPKKVKGLQIKFDGFAKVSWPEYDNKSNAEEQYFSRKYFVFGNDTSEREIPPGKTEYPFSTTLPDGLPTSFESGHGHIRYTVKAILERPRKKAEESKILITVITPVDLNDVPKVKEPVLKETSISFCCLCCKSGPLTLAGFIPHSGYVPGESIVTTIDVDNATDVRISSVRCLLRKEVKWIVKVPKYFERVNKLDLKEVLLGEVAPHSSKSWTQNIEIPQMTVTNLDSCSIIKVEYYLEISAIPTGGYKGLDMKLPIVLGSLPLFTEKNNGVISTTLPLEEIKIEDSAIELQDKGGVIDAGDNLSLH